MSTLSTSTISPSSMSNEPAKADVFIDSEGNRVSGSDPKAAYKIASKGVVPDAKVAARYKDAFSAEEPKAAAKTAVKSDGDTRESKGVKKSASSDK